MTGTAQEVVIRSLENGMFEIQIDKEAVASLYSLDAAMTAARLLRNIHPKAVVYLTKINGHQTALHI